VRSSASRAATVSAGSSAAGRCNWFARLAFPPPYDVTALRLTPALSLLLSPPCPALLSSEGYNVTDPVVILSFGDVGQTVRVQGTVCMFGLVSGRDHTNTPILCLETWCCAHQVTSVRSAAGLPAVELL